MNKKVIVLGNDHTNTLGLTQVLGREGFYVIDVVWGRRRGYVKASRYCKEFYSSHTPEECINLLLTIPFSGVRIPIIASCDDAACVLESHRKKLSDRFLFEHSKGQYSINELMDKHLQVALAKEAGLTVPGTWGSTEEHLFSYPVLLKPEVSHFGAKSDIRICNTYMDYIREKNSLNDKTRFVVQKYIERDYEISILGCSLSNGEVYIPCVENKLTLFPPKVGLECLANMQPLDDNELKKAITNLLRKMEYVGLFSVEMMHCKQDGLYYFTEINLRNDGANSFVYKYGVNLPLLHICDLNNEALPSFDKTHPGYYIWDMHHFMSLRNKCISFRQWFKEIRNSKGFLVYFSDDKRPFFLQYIYLFKRHFGIIKESFY